MQVDSFLDACASRLRQGLICALMQFKLFCSRYYTNANLFFITAHRFLKIYFLL